MKRYWPLMVVLLWTPTLASADTLLVAVASNFTSTLEDIAQRFEERTGHRVRIIAASTGVHYAQILNGAPFDMLFAADAQRPRLLEQDGQAVAGTRFTYAFGRLVLWSLDPALVDSEASVLGSGNFTRLAVANPDTAPYGAAALQALERLGLLESVRPKLVTGTNISQTHQFVASGAAPLGLVAYSQVAGPGIRPTGSYWLVPESLHEPVDQQAVLLKESPAGREFLEFVRSEPIRELIESYGYRVGD